MNQQRIATVRMSCRLGIGRRFSIQSHTWIKIPRSLMGAQSVLKLANSFGVVIFLQPVNAASFYCSQVFHRCFFDSARTRAGREGTVELNAGS